MSESMLLNNNLNLIALAIFFGLAALFCLFANPKQTVRSTLPRASAQVSTVTRLYCGVPTDPEKQVCTTDWIKEHVQCCTVYFTTGIWQGSAELSLILEIIDADQDAVKVLAESWCKDFQQDCVYVTVAPLNSARLISAPSSKVVSISA